MIQLEKKLVLYLYKEDDSYEEVQCTELLVPNKDCNKKVEINLKDYVNKKFVKLELSSNFYPCIIQNLSIRTKQDNIEFRLKNCIEHEQNIIILNVEDKICLNTYDNDLYIKCTIIYDLEEVFKILVQKYKIVKCRLEDKALEEIVYLSKIEELKKELNNQSNYLNIANLELIEYKQDIYNLKNSSCWKITKPIRVIVAFIKKVNLLKELLNFLKNRYNSKKIANHSVIKVNDCDSESLLNILIYKLEDIRIMENLEIRNYISIDYEIIVINNRLHIDFTKLLNFYESEKNNFKKVLYHEIGNNITSCDVTHLLKFISAKYIVLFTKYNGNFSDKFQESINFVMNREINVLFSEEYIFLNKNILNNLNKKNLKGKSIEFFIFLSLLDNKCDLIYCISDRGIELAKIFNAKSILSMELNYNLVNEYDKPSIGILIDYLEIFNPATYIRIISPYFHECIQEKFYIEFIDIEKFTNYIGKIDILVISRMVIKKENNDIIDEIISLCKRNNIKVVFEIDDDLFNIDKNHVDYSYYKYILPLIYKTANNSNLIITSTVNLKSIALNYNTNVSVFNNYINENIWKDLNSNKIVNNVNIVTMGYIGTITHHNDIYLIRESIIKAKEILINNYNIELKFKIIGGVLFEAEDTFYDIVRVPENKMHYPKFAEFLNNATLDWDFVIAPLEFNSINKSKSALKYLEYSILKLPGIYTCYGEYPEFIKNNCTGLLINDNNLDDWTKFICLMARDAEFRNKISCNAYKDVTENYLMKNNVFKLKEILEKLLKI